MALTNCENSAIGIPGTAKGISGGERKRVAFATEVNIGSICLKGEHNLVCILLFFVVKQVDTETVYFSSN